MNNRLTELLRNAHAAAATADNKHRVGVFTPAEIAAQTRQAEKNAAERARGDEEWAKQAKAEADARGNRDWKLGS